MKDGSCVTLGTGKGVTDLEESRAVLNATVKRIIPGADTEVRVLRSICTVDTSTLMA